jgi:hypothetical protein
MHWLSWSKTKKAKCYGGLGFRDLRLFNSALLVRQCWRLLHSPHSLAFRMLKERYFLNSSFMGAIIPKNASFTWRSILGARKVIELGSRWRVGNGEKIRIWKDRWLPTPTTYKVVSPISLLPEEARVSDLLIQDSQCWNSRLIDEVFLPRDASIIKSTPLSFRRPQDKIIWYGNHRGIFTVKSAYLLLQQNSRGSIMGESSSSCSVEKF